MFGRRTYELFEGHWARITDPDDPLATRLNRQPKYVVSRTLERVGWNNSTLLAGDVHEAVATLKQQPGGELQVHGSGTLAQTLMQRDLIDEYRLFIHPVVLGDGKRLFNRGTIPTAFELIDVKTTSRGVAVHVYRPQGRPHFGAATLEQDGDIVKGATSTQSTN